MMNAELLSSGASDLFEWDHIVLATYALANMVPVLADIFYLSDATNAVLMTQIDNASMLALMSNITDNMFGSVAAVWRFFDIYALDSNIFGVNEASPVHCALSKLSMSVFCILSALAITAIAKKPY